MSRHELSQTLWSNLASANHDVNQLNLPSSAKEKGERKSKSKLSNHDNECELLMSSSHSSTPTFLVFSRLFSSSQTSPLHPADSETR